MNQKGYAKRPLYPFSRSVRPAQVKSGGSYVVLVPSWLAVASTAIADDAQLRIDVHLRTPNVQRLHVEVLWRRAR